MVYNPYNDRWEIAATRKSKQSRPIDFEDGIYEDTYGVYEGLFDSDLPASHSSRGAFWMQQGLDCLDSEGETYQRMLCLK